MDISPLAVPTLWSLTDPMIRPLCTQGTCWPDKAIGMPKNEHLPTPSEPSASARVGRGGSLKLQRGSTSVQPKIRQLSKTYVLLVLYSRTNPLDDWCGPQCALLLVWKSSAPLMFCLMFGISFAFQTSSSEKQSFISMFPTKKRVTIWLFITM